MFDTAIFGAGLLCFGLAIAGVLMTAREFERLDDRRAR